MTVNQTVPTRIMVAVDGSECGYRAADFAIALASRLQSEITIINVIGASSTIPDYRVPADIVAALEDMGTEILSKCGAKARQNGVKFETLLVSGDPANEILRNAKEKNCDLIIMGKRGLGKLERLLIGSVSTKVSNLSDIPVTLVR